MTAPRNDDQTPEVDQDQTPPAGGDNDNDKTGRETRQDRRDRQARERAAELETERDKLAARVEGYQTREVERIAAQVLAQPGDLLALGGVTLADLTDPETGELLNEEEILGIAAALVDQRPGLGVPKPRGGHPDWGHSRTSDQHAPGGSGAPSWADAFGAAGRGGAHYT